MGSQRGEGGASGTVPWWRGAVTCSGTECSRPGPWHVRWLRPRPAGGLPGHSPACRLAWPDSWSATGLAHEPPAGRERQRGPPAQQAGRRGAGHGGGRGGGRAAARGVHVAGHAINLTGSNCSNGSPGVPPWINTVASRRAAPVTSPLLREVTTSCAGRKGGSGSGRQAEWVGAGGRAGGAHERGMAGGRSPARRAVLGWCAGAAISPDTHSAAPLSALQPARPQNTLAWASALQVWSSRLCTPAF